MKKAVSFFLASSVLVAAPGVLFNAASACAQAAPAAAAPAAGQVQMEPAEFAVYDAALNKQTTPQTQAPALEDYLKKYPNSAVKADVLQRIMIDYSQFDPAKALTAADAVLQVSPGDFTALTFESVLRAQTAQAAADPATRQAGLDSAADYATKALAASKPASMDQATYDKQKTALTPTFYSTIGGDDLAKKDYAGAITAYTTELSSVPVDQTTVPGTALQDTYFLGQAYYASTPPDYVKCTFYTTRAATYAPANFKSQFQPLASYCYKKYHGTADGYDAVVTAAKANLNPPSGFTITPAPSDADIAHKTVTDTADLSTLALSDKEYILANGTTEDAEKVFATVKGKADKVPDATVISATADSVQVAFSDDAIQSKTPDITFNMKTPLKTVPAVGSKVTLIGTWASYTQKPLMITMSDSEIATKAAAAPAHKAPVRHR